ncbi:MAG TPA: hypothetical protein VH024_17470 [Candidatus Angelobacter sp.]|jgi:hypothetical protein|nr:hypothetical protein [Candidatus Angelobacter sp.]
MSRPWSEDFSADFGPFAVTPMAQAFYQVISATGATAGLYGADWQQSPFNLTYVVEVPGGTTVSYSVQYTLDDMNDLTWTPIWINDSVNGSATTVTGTNTYKEQPIRWLRVNVASISGGNIRFAVLQGSSAR